MMRGVVQQLKTESGIILLIRAQHSGLVTMNDCVHYYSPPAAASHGTGPSTIIVIWHMAEIYDDHIVINILRVISFSPLSLYHLHHLLKDLSIYLTRLADQILAGNIRRC